VGWGMKPKLSINEIIETAYMESVDHASFYEKIKAAQLPENSIVLKLFNALKHCDHLREQVQIVKNSEKKKREKLAAQCTKEYQKRIAAENKLKNQMNKEREIWLSQNQTVSR
jgi:Txe/YoeB family toxin of Txe-Axe toxin-antitoxin module